jgi:hypothetical protein
MWRQGDVLIERVDSIPTDAAERKDLVLAEGTATGHQHRVEEAKGVRLFERQGTLYLDVFGASARIVHPEHGPIALKRGRYRVWRQREFADDLQPRFVMD